MPRDLNHGVTEQSKAARHRRDDAAALFEKGRWRASMYLAGYSVECLIKAKLMRRFGCWNLKELEETLKNQGLIADNASVYTHQLAILLRLTGRRDAIRNNAVLWRQFNIVNQWIPAWRYSPDLSREEDARDFLAAVDVILSWIEHNV